MKNIITGIFCLSLAVSCLSACSNKDVQPVDISPSAVTTTETEVLSETTTTKSATTATAATEPETEVVYERNPDDFYINFKPLSSNVFVGNEISCEPDIYAEQVKLIDEEIDYIYGEDYNPSLEAKLLIGALLSNQNIEYRFKKRLFHMVEYFDDNLYLPREEIYNKLLTLQIKTQTFGEDDEGFFYGAATSTDTNEIEFYIIVTDELVESYENSPQYEETGLSYVENDEFDMIKHEIFHVVTSSKIDNLCSFLNEGMTVLLEKEYNNGDLYTNYDQRIVYLKMLIEVIGRDKVLEAYSNGDWSVIETELLKIDPDESKPPRIMDLIDEWQEVWDMSDCDFDITNESTTDIRIEMSQILTDYYFIVHPDADESSLYSMYNIIFTNGTDDFLWETTEVYFNSRYEEDSSIKRLY